MWRIFCELQALTVHKGEILHTFNPSRPKKVQAISTWNFQAENTFELRKKLQSNQFYTHQSQFKDKICVFPLYNFVCNQAFNACDAEEQKQALVKSTELFSDNSLKKT